MSLVEAATNVVVGYGFALVTQMLLFVALDLHVTLQENVTLASVFTMISLARSYLLRRLFEGIRTEELRGSGR